MWIKVRAFGELQILTKASYFILILVPILASIWPGVQYGLSNYNLSISNATTEMNNAADRIEFAVLSNSKSGLNTKIADEIMSSVQKQLSTATRLGEENYINSTKMPIVWAIAFFASLAVLIAHLVYQSQAPELIRRVTIREHMRNEVREFSDSPSEGHLNRARKNLRYAGAFIDSEIEGAINDNLPESNSDKEKRQELTVIEQGAYGEYLRAAYQNRLGAATSGIFYIIGIVLIIWIIIQQSLKVIAATW